MFSLRESNGILFDYTASGVVFFVDPMSKAHDELFIFPSLLQESVRILNRFNSVKVFHGCLVSSSMKRTSKGSDSAGNSTVKVRSSGNSDSGVESRGIKVVLSVKN